MNERQYDPLEELLTELEPEEALMEKVSPLGLSAQRILVGLALCTMSIHLLFLNDLLPTIGEVLLLLGFRTLRRENFGFRLCWCLTFPRLGLQLASLILHATIYWEALQQSALLPLLNGLTIGLQLSLLLGFVTGLRSLRRKAGLPPGSRAALRLLLWYSVMVILGLYQYSGFFIGVLMLVCYFLILKELRTAFRELEDAGYVVTAAPVRVSDSTVKKLSAAIAVLGIILGYLCWSSYPMTWTPVETSTSQEVQEIRTHLLSLGFPEDVLEDLTTEDLLDCAGAEALVVQQEDHPMNDGREVRYQSGNYTEISTVYDVKELRLSGVGVRLTDGRWKLFHHFHWTVNPGFRGTEAMLFQTEDPRREDDWTESGSWSGQLLLERDGQTLRADYAQLGPRSFSIENPIFPMGPQTGTRTVAAFSFPRSGTDQRGYVSYTLEAPPSDILINSWMDYVHQEHRFHYPVETAAAYGLRGGWQSFFFRICQDALQFDPYDEPLMTLQQWLEQS